MEALNRSMLSLERRLDVLENRLEVVACYFAESVFTSDANGAKDAADQISR